MMLSWIGAKKIKSRPAVRSVRLRVEQLEDRCVPSATDFGIADNFNAFVLSNFTGQGSDVQGRLAIGHDANLTGYGIGDGLSNSHGTRDDLIVGHNLTYTNGQVFNGNIDYFHAAALTSVGIPNGILHQGYPVNFSAARADLLTKSANWSQFDTSGTIANQWGGLFLTGTDPNLNVFDISAAQLQNIWGVTINAPAGSTVLVNVSGTNVSLQNLGMNVVGTDHSRVVFNFAHASTIDLQGVGFQGNILAPKAKVTFNNGNLLGTLVSDSFTGNGQFNLSALNINIPAYVPARISGTVFNDLNSNGVQDPGELGIPGATLILQGGGLLNPITTQTDRAGNYSFVNVPPGNYIVAVVPPGLYAVASVAVGTVNSVPDGTGDLPDGQINNIVLGGGAHGIHYNFGLIIPSGGGGD